MSCGSGKEVQAALPRPQKRIPRALRTICADNDAAGVLEDLFPAACAGSWRIKYRGGREKGSQATPAAADEESKRLADLPEVKAKLAEILAQHYDSWVNESLPALGGRTSLEAV